MSVLVLLATLAAAPPPEPAGPVDRFRVEVSERTRAETLAAVLVATRSRWTTKWVLRWTANNDPSTTGEYRGVSLAEQAWIEGKVRDIDAIGGFTLALGNPLWMANLPGCPRSGIPTIQRLP